jgi:hypothetical protein
MIKIIFFRFSISILKTKLGLYRFRRKIKFLNENFKYLKE